MRIPFDPTRRTILVDAELTGPKRTITLKLLLDTGASDTFVEESYLVAAGYSLSGAVNQFQVVTGSGIISVTEVVVSCFASLGQTRADFPILAHSFHPGAGYEGVLGLDFLRGNILTIDFVNGEIALTAGGATP